MSELFVVASRSKYRFPSPKGPLTIEQLWDLPLQTTTSNGASLDGTAKIINRDLHNSIEESFVETAENPAKTENQNKLDIVKYVIQVRVAENKASLNRLKVREERQRIMAALSAKDEQELSTASREDLLKKLEALDA